ncbi:hypothetical protein FACS1894162_3560 [Bacteroidia bacterium]|nr:hypothetical protein FACS1894162_3560 [Bacteroidia bacterium]
MSKKATDKKGKIIINQMTIKAPTRKINDIGTWRNAIKSADIGRPIALFDLFDDLYLDGILFDAVDKRTKAVTNAELTFQNADKEQVQEIADLIDSIGFEEMLTIIMKSRFYGRSGLEFDFTDGFRVDEIPAKHINLDNRVILLDQSADTGISYENDDQLLVIGKKRDFGLFIRTAPLIIWKRGGFGDYAQWLELFGMPQRIGKYSSYDPESRKLLEDALEKAGSAPYAVIPKESEVETVQNTGNGSSGSAYNQFRQSCNEETLITILGQTLTTIQGTNGARSLGEVHKAVEESKNKADMRFVQHILNTLVLPVLEKRGYPVTGGKFVFPKAAEALTVSDIVSLSDILPIATGYLYEKFSIPAPKDGEEIAHRQTRVEEIEVEEPAPSTPPTSNQNKKIKNTDQSQLSQKSLTSFIQHLHDFFAKAPAAMTGAAKHFTTKLTDSITGTINLADKDEPALRIDIAGLFNKALKEIYGATLNSSNFPTINKQLFEITNNALQTGITTQFAKAGLEFGTKNQAFINEFKYNTSVFSAFKNHRQTEEIIGLLTDENGQVRSFYDFKKRALKVSEDYNVNWLKTEYNTTVRAARSAVNWKQYEADKRMYPNLEYIESKAKEKRQSHLDWVGTILPIDHPWWEAHMPPSDWNCQCSVRQTDKPVTAVPDDDGSDPVFRNNPGKTAEFVNFKEHPYIKGTDDEDKKEVEKFLKKQEIKQLEIWAKKNLVGVAFDHIDPKFEKQIAFSGKGISEFLNQPHNHYYEKNELIKNIQKVIQGAAYRGVTQYKGRTSHIFEIEIKGDKSWIIVNESNNGDIFLHSISESDKVLIGIKK